MAEIPRSAYVNRTQLVDAVGIQEEGVNKVALYAWQSSTLSYVKLGVDAAGNLMVVGSGGGGGAVTIADGADVTEGAIADTAVYGDSSGTLSAKLRGINAVLRGIGTAAAPTTANVSDVDGVVVSANANRKKMVIINTGSEVVSFGDGQAAVAGSGITLTANGTWVMDWATFTTGAIHAVCASGKTSTLGIQEYS